MYLPTVLIASLALIFTVSSFWWLNARPGRLVFYSVTTFGGYINTQTLVIQIPVVVHNTGAKPRVVRELRLEAIDQTGSTFRLEAQTFQKKLGPDRESEDFVHPFAVNGRSVMTKYIRFATDNVPLLAPGESIKLVLQGLVDEQDNWVDLKTLDIHVGILVSYFITMSNNPAHWKSSTLTDGREHQDAVMGLLRESRKASAGDLS